MQKHFIAFPLRDLTRMLAFGTELQVCLSVCVFMCMQRNQETVVFAFFFFSVLETNATMKFPDLCMYILCVL